MTRLSIESKYKLRTGYEIPILGFGVGPAVALLRTLLANNPPNRPQGKRQTAISWKTQRVCLRLFKP